MKPKNQSVSATLKAVLVLFCGGEQREDGAIELWRNDPADSKDMTLDDGYYGTTADAFEFMSRRTSFRPTRTGCRLPDTPTGHADTPGRTRCWSSSSASPSSGT